MVLAASDLDRITPRRIVAGRRIDRADAHQPAGIGLRSFKTALRACARNLQRDRNARGSAASAGALRIPAAKAPAVRILSSRERLACASSAAKGATERHRATPPRSVPATRRRIGGYRLGDVVARGLGGLFKRRQPLCGHRARRTIGALFSRSIAGAPQLCHRLGGRVMLRGLLAMAATASLRWLAAGRRDAERLQALSAGQPLGYRFDRRQFGDRLLDLGQTLVQGIERLVSASPHNAPAPDRSAEHKE